jgi:hypothetical protein
MPIGSCLVDTNIFNRFKVLTALHPNAVLD